MGIALPRWPNVGENVAKVPSQELFQWTKHGLGPHHIQQVPFSLFSPLKHPESASELAHPKGLLIANLLAKTVDMKVPVRVMDEYKKEGNKTDAGHQGGVYCE